MPDIASVFVRASIVHVALSSFLSGFLVLLLLSSCAAPDPTPPVSIRLYQNWQLQPGDMVAGFSVLGGLGDISIALNNRFVYAPFDGRTQRDERGCVFFSSPDVPAYLFRLCGLSNPRLGELHRGEAIGNGMTLQFGTLRKQPNGTWALVEPSNQILERTLIAP